jgi:hypothetical protein
VANEGASEIGHAGKQICQHRLRNSAQLRIVPAPLPST